MPPRVLIVEDEARTAETVRLYLERAGFAVTHAADGGSALERALAEHFDVVVLDILLPGPNGHEICRRLRQQEPAPMILLLSALSTEDDRVRGLDLGADDYLTKPFSPRELVARVRALLRRGSSAAPAASPLSWRGLRLDPDRRQVWRDDRPVSLTTAEFDLLATLMGSPGRVFRREQLIEHALGGTDFTGTDFTGNGRTVDTHVANLRRKIEPDRTRPRYIGTVVGVGYRFGPEAGKEGGGS